MCVCVCVLGRGIANVLVFQSWWGSGVKGQGSGLKSYPVVNTLTVTSAVARPLFPVLDKHIYGL